MYALKLGVCPPVQHKLATLCKHEGTIADCCIGPGLSPAQQVVRGCVNTRYPRQGQSKQIWPAAELQAVAVQVKFCESGCVAYAWDSRNISRFGYTAASDCSACVANTCIHVVP